MSFDWILLGLGVLVGFPLGLTGSGGSILAIPLLVYGAKLPMKQALPLSLVIVGCIAAFGAVKLSFEGKTNWFIALMFSLSGMFFSPVAVALTIHVHETFRLGSFALLMLVVAWRMARQQLNGAQPPRGQNENERKGYIPIIIGGAFSGVLSGFFGVGGGFVITPLLILIFAIPYSEAVGTSLASITMISFSALIGYFIEGFAIDFDVLMTFVAGGAIGLLLGVFAINKVSEQTAKRIFALTTTVFAIFILINIFFLHEGNVL